MHLSLLAALVGLAHGFASPEGSGLVVTTVPDHVRPYAVRAYTLDGYRVGSQVYRFPVTGLSSGNAFTLISTAAPSSPELGVLPHLHKSHYENFYCLRGRFALWTSKSNSTSGRILISGDYGAVPPDTTHTFQTLDPFVEMVGVIQPGGFEELFYFLASANYSSPTYAPFPQGNFTSPGGNPEVISALEKYDVFAQLHFSPPMDFNANGATEEGAVWHNGNNGLAKDSETPFFVAKGYGSKYLAGNASSSYLIVEPFITDQQSNGNFAQGTVTLSQLGKDATAASYTFKGHTALEVVDGLVGVKVGGYDESLTLAIGDVVFVPGGTMFSFWGEAAYSKVLYVGQGKDGLDRELKAGAREYDSVVFPSS